MKQAICEPQEELAKYESPMSAGELLGELYPLMKDYFDGEILFDGQTLTYRMPNGQTFKITAQKA